MYTRDGVFDVHFFFLQTVYIFKCISLVKRYSLSFSLFFSSAPPAAILPLLYIVLFHCITTRARSPPRHAFTGQKCVCVCVHWHQIKTECVLWAAQECLYPQIGAERCERAWEIFDGRPATVIWTVKKYTLMYSIVYLRIISYLYVLYYYDYYYTCKCV